jgi:ATP-dependent Zn protease
MPKRKSTRQTGRGGRAARPRRGFAGSGGRSGRRPAEALRATAFHEAGHAVAAVVQGLHVVSVSVVETRNYVGVCLEPTALGYQFENWNERRQIARACIIGSYAGLAAERLVDPDAPDLHGQNDEVDAMQTSTDYVVLPPSCRSIGDEAHLAYLSRLREKARWLVRKHRDTIGDVAAALLKHGTLDGARVEEIVQRRKGKASVAGSDV